MDTTPFDDLIAHWHSLPIANGAKVPAKSSFTPQALIRHLPNIGLFERVERYDMRIRLFGTGLDEKFDRRMTGQNMFDLQPKGYWEFYADLFDAVMETPAGCQLSRKTMDAKDYIVHGESLILPMANQAGEAHYTVGMLLMESESPLDDPIDSSRLHHTRITGVEFIDIGYGLPCNPPELPD